MLFNIKTTDGKLMLGVACDHVTATKYLRKYQDGVGKPFPNGRGVYPDRGYHLVETNEGALSVETVRSLEQYARRKRRGR